MPGKWLCALLACLLAGDAALAVGKRYRGEYTLGHEVNSFCPENGSKCYWIGPNTSQTAREQLERIYREQAPGLYQPVCVLVEGVVDRQAFRDGFAADYDGLIDIGTILDDCGDGVPTLPDELNSRR